MTELASGRWVVGASGLVRETDTGARRLSPDEARPGSPFRDLFDPAVEPVLVAACRRAAGGERVALALPLARHGSPAVLVLEPAPGGASALVVALARAGGLGATEVEGVAHGIAHDLGAHVRALTSFATFLLEDAGTAFPSAAREDLTRLEGATARLKAGLDGLVRYLRAPGEGPAVGSLRAAALQAARELEADFAARGGSVAVEGDDARVPIATAELASLVRALLENALEHGGPRVRVALSRTPERARIAVADDGPGLSPDERARAALPFTRLRPRAPGEVHPGLGLATVARALAAAGGWLELDRGESGGLEARLELARLRDDPTP